MAGTLIPQGQGGQPLSQTFMVVESTYGDATRVIVPADDRIYIENWKHNPSTEMIQRTGHAPFRGGWRPVAGVEKNELSGNLPVRSYPIASAADLPHEHPGLIASGATLDSSGAGGTPFTQVYNWTSCPQGSVFIEHRDRDCANLDKLILFQFSNVLLHHLDILLACFYYQLHD